MHFPPPGFPNSVSVPIERGVVIGFYPKPKNYGFIRPEGFSIDDKEDNSRDIFFHASNIINGYRFPRRGHAVEYYIHEYGDDKVKAVDVTRLVDGSGAGNSCGGRVGMCFNCRGFGHVARVCPSGRGAGKGCYNCGEHGHVARDCQKVASPAGGGGGGRGRCGSERSGGGDNGGECYNCGEKGHYKRECVNYYRNN